jgi:REP element-mobilizing transposase RayT
MRQVAFKFRTWGGKRVRAGRKQVNARKSEPHRKRKAITRATPVHVSLRVAPYVRRLRRMDVYRAIRQAMEVVLRRIDVRIVHMSIQGNHIHLLVEAENAKALARGMQAFQIAAARRINGDRRGTVFPDRYHATVIGSPRQARNALAYVLNNWRRHREDRARETRGWQIDKYSSAIGFTGWAGGTTWQVPPDYEPLPVCTAQSWLLAEGWKRHGAIGIGETPGPLPA